MERKACVAALRVRGTRDAAPSGAPRGPALHPPPPLLPPHPADPPNPSPSHRQGKYTGVLVEALGGWGGLQRLLQGIKPIADKVRARARGRPRPRRCAEMLPGGG